MLSISQVSKLKQPRGGYLPPSLFAKIDLGGTKISYDDENIRAWSTARTVKYLTLSFRKDGNVRSAFELPLMGADNVAPSSKQLTESITDNLDGTSIKAACRLSGFEKFCYSKAGDEMPEDWSVPDRTTIEHIEWMTRRAIRFFDENCDVLGDNGKFPGAYTPIVSNGVIDLYSFSTLWLIATSTKETPVPRNTLGLLLCYIMSRHTTGWMKGIYADIENIGIYNPRTDTAFILPVKKIDPELITKIEREYCGYSCTRTAVIKRLCSLFNIEAEDEYSLREIIAYVNKFTQPYVYDDGKCRIVAEAPAEIPHLI